MMWEAFCWQVCVYLPTWRKGLIKVNKVIPTHFLYPMVVKLWSASRGLWRKRKSENGWIQTRSYRLLPGLEESIVTDVICILNSMCIFYWCVPACCEFPCIVIKYFFWFHPNHRIVTMIKHFYPDFSDLYQHDSVSIHRAWELTEMAGWIWKLCKSYTIIC